MGTVITIHRETETNEKIDLAEIRRNNFLNEWFEDNLNYFNEEDEEHEISKEDFKNLKSQLEKCLELDYENVKEVFDEIEEKDYKEKLNEILEIVNKCLSFDDKNYFYYSYYF